MRGLLGFLVHEGVTGPTGRVVRGTFLLKLVLQLVPIVPVACVLLALGASPMVAFVLGFVLACGLAALGLDAALEFLLLRRVARGEAPLEHSLWFVDVIRDQQARDRRERDEFLRATEDNPTLR